MREEKQLTWDEARDVVEKMLAPKYKGDPGPEFITISREIAELLLYGQYRDVKTWSDDHEDKWD